MFFLIIEIMHILTAIVCQVSDKHTLTKWQIERHCFGKVLYCKIVFLVRQVIVKMNMLCR